MMMENNKVKEIIPVMHCFDNNFVIPAAVSFYSMLKNASREYGYALYVLHDNITKANQKKLTEIVTAFPDCSLDFIDTNGKFADLIKAWGGETTTFSKEVIYKILAPEYFPQYDKMIITDVDVAFLGDISEEYIEFDITEGGADSDKYIAAEGRFHETYLRDYTDESIPEEIRREKFQILGGYWIINNKLWRNEKRTIELTEYAYKHIKELQNLEQTLVNICLFPHFKILPCTTLVAEGEYLAENRVGKSTEEIRLMDEMCANPMQLHFSMKNLKPWNNLLLPHWCLWFDFLRETPFLEDYMKNLQEAVTTADSVVKVFRIKIPKRNRYCGLLRMRLKAVRLTRMLTTRG